VPKARIAPDGRFTVVRRYGQTSVELSGRVVGHRIKGRVGLEIGDCSGGYAFTLERKT